MKHFRRIIFAGLMVHFLPLSAETEEVVSAIPSALVVENENSLLKSLEDELLLLEEEFKTLLEEKADEPSLALEAIAPPVLEAEPAPAAVEESIALEQTAPIVEESVALEQPVVEESIAAPVVEMEESIALEQMLPAVQEEQQAVASTPIPAAEEKPIAIEFSLESSDALEKEVEILTTSNSTGEDEDLFPLKIERSSMVEKPAALNTSPITVDLNQAFSGSPIIYSLLLAMSVCAVGIWLYSIFAMRSSARVSSTFLKNVQNKLNSNNFDDALLLCQERKGLFCNMLSSAICARRHGLPVMIEAMKAEGKRSSTSFWQKIGLLNDIAIIAPMLGLLGTVLGMFYAFYDVNRSIESISTLFDGLGISVGTTVAGLIVAILSLILHSTAKYRLVRALSRVENEAQSAAVLIDDRTSIHKG